MRIVGYYNSFNNLVALEELDVSCLTHLNYAFLIPRADGTLYFLQEDSVKNTINFCHSRGIRVFVSIGGWCDENNKELHKVFEKICISTDKIKLFVDNIIEIVDKFGFDGVDLDWEYPTAEQKFNFAFLVARLSMFLHHVDKEMSIAIYHSVHDEPKFERICAVTNYVVSNLDFVNIMTYDCHEEKNHSSLKLAQKCIDYWTNTRGIRKEKLLIGIAFYAKPSQTPYALLVKQSHKNAHVDFCGTDSYNGLKTVKRKTKYAKSNCGGVFIWAINYDSPGKLSLLSAIKKAL